MRAILLFSGLACIAVCNALHAESGANISQDAHVHGLAELTLALEGNDLEMRLESPAANIVGFEHKASTAEQRRIVDKAKAILESSQQLFSFFGTSCTLKKAHADFAAVTGSNEHKHHRHDDHHHHDEDKDTHSEITAAYHFDCQQGSKLTSLSVNLFDHFSGFEKINVMWLTDTKQGAAKLTTASKTLHLR